ncbi:MAG: 30S ribosomal protein S8 [Deltaproteobacteria bacterium]|nr:30S ribosomal protein S8 [Deltaproteobacteria bacterium]MBW1920365.1 30S ribosomal protein S8 [Deltaproteobacteria bacterium]MBW1934910.1 30S ribosomal protein S8 [Deltaproteobacteria bacterium]MBW1978250.1 30S ribosomal protein S8 [Deltaproteobacteria bacterium]MBW2044512.1 30S ribosomal protein S8 [Deltaproteobacteria bacterium]
MSISDPIADMLTRIRNAMMASYETVDIPRSKLKINIAKILRAEGYIKNYKIVPDRRQGFIRIFLKYDDKGEPVITGLKRVSKPSARVYAPSDKLPSVLNGYGINIISTSKGVMTDKQARKMGIGGEILCSVW